MPYTADNLIEQFIEKLITESSYKKLQNYITSINPIPIGKVKKSIRKFLLEQAQQEESDIKEVLFTTQEAEDKASAEREHREGEDDRLLWDQTQEHLQKVTTHKSTREVERTAMLVFMKQNIDNSKTLLAMRKSLSSLTNNSAACEEHENNIRVQIDVLNQKKQNQENDLRELAITEASLLSTLSDISKRIELRTKAEHERFIRAVVRLRDASDLDALSLEHRDSLRGLKVAQKRDRDALLKEIQRALTENGYPIFISRLEAALINKTPLPNITAKQAKALMCMLRSSKSNQAAGASEPNPPSPGSFQEVSGSKEAERSEVEPVVLLHTPAPEPGTLNPSQITGASPQNAPSSEPFQEASELSAEAKRPEVEPLLPPTPVPGPATPTPSQINWSNFFSSGTIADAVAKVSNGVAAVFGS